MNNRRGRPSGGATDADERILRAAQRLFAERGYTKTTLRAIADEAGCDVSLIAYHHGPKKDLFAKSMSLTLKPTLVLVDALKGERSRAPERLAWLVLQAWDDPQNRGPLLAVVQAGVHRQEVMHAFADYLRREIYDTLVEYFGGRDASQKAASTLAIVVGIIFSRYVVQIEPLASWPPGQVLTAMRPALAAGSQRRRN